VGDHRHRTETHGCGGEHRIEQDAEKRVEDAGGEGNAEEVIDEGEEEILANVGHGATAQEDSAGQAAQIALHEGDAGRFDGDVGAGAHGNADVSCGQGGGVVDAVARHGDAAAVRFQ